MGKGLDWTLLQWVCIPGHILHGAFAFLWVSMGYGGEHPSFGEQGGRRSGGVGVSPFVGFPSLFSFKTQTQGCQTTPWAGGILLLEVVVNRA